GLLASVPRDRSSPPGRSLFTFAMARLHKPPSVLTLDDLDAPFIGAFLEDLEEPGRRRQNAQLAPDRHPILLRVRVVRRASLQRSYSARPCDTQQATRQAPAVLPDPAGDRGTPRCP